MGLGLLLMTLAGVGFPSKIFSPYRLYQKIDIPTAFTQHRHGLTFGGDIRIGDLENRGRVGFLVYRTANRVKGGASQPCFLGAFTMKGKVLWQKGNGGEQPNRPGPVAIHDIDGDGESEVICLFAEDTTSISPFSMQHISLQILNGQEGSVEKAVQSISLQAATGKGPNWVHQRILIANLKGHLTPQEFIIKLGKTLFAFDHELNLLWTYYNANDQYQHCPAYIPAVGDLDGDGKDEINGGYYVLDDDGSVLWERKLGKNMDCVLIDYWDNDSLPRAICSGHGFVMNALGDTLLHVGERVIPHGQELRIADFDAEIPGREMLVRYNGHKPEVRLIGQMGEVIRAFRLNDSPNHTGMEVVYGRDKSAPALLYNGGALWNGRGKMIWQFEELTTPAVGNFRQGWYHCIPVDFAGDDGEEIVIYNPWESDIFIYAPNRNQWRKKKRYLPGPRQYNVRLLD